MEQEPKLIVFPDGTKVITEIQEVSSEMGEPDCRLVNPYVIKEDETLEAWLAGYTTKNIFMIHSDKFLTITTPRKTHIDKYKNLIS